jgi:hypothetical protein
MTRKKLIGALALTGAMLGALPSVANAEIIWTPVRFSDNTKAKTIVYGNGERVTGGVFICNDDSAIRTIGITQYVRVNSAGEYSPWRRDVLPSPSGTCPGWVPVAWDLPPGPSRKIVFWVNGGRFTPQPHSYNIESESLELTAAYQLTLAADDRKVRNGDTVFFSGAMPAYFSAGTPTLLLQVRVGKKWRTFKTLQTLGDGSYFATYRFTNTRSRQTYKFRAKPLGPTLYPFAVSPSRKVKVKVKP